MDRGRLLAVLRGKGIYVSEHDPVLDTADICETAIVDAVKALDDLTRLHADRMTAAMVQQTEATKSAATEIAGRAGEEAARRLRDGADEATRSLLRYVDERIERVERAAKSSVYAAWGAAGAAIVTLGALAGAMRLFG